MQHIFFVIPLLLNLTPTNARWLEAVSLIPRIFNATSGEWHSRVLDPIVWFDRIDQEESPDYQDRAFLTGKRGDIYDCSNNVVPPGAMLNTIGYYPGDVNLELPERLNRLEIHRVEDCEDDDPYEIGLEVEDGWGGSELGMQGQNMWMYYNNFANAGSPSGDRIEEEEIYSKKDAIEEEEVPAAPEDDEFQWISREEASSKKLRKREPQAPSGSEQEEALGPDEAQSQPLPGGSFGSPVPNINPNRAPQFNWEPLTPDSGNSQRGGFEPNMANQVFGNPSFRRLDYNVAGGFGGGGEGQADWDPFDSAESKDTTSHIQFPGDGMNRNQRHQNEVPVQFRENNIDIPLENIQVPVIENFRVQDPYGLLLNGRAVPPRNAEEWLNENREKDSESDPLVGPPSLGRTLPPVGRPDLQIFVARMWPEYQLGPRTSFRFVFDPYVVHDTNIT
ncbi:hypothetical protein TWF730_010468 [Orbilia blumenaviensis]|uniref:Uncharacterized protein n=1 Tax=Orbilia blumenaviensis TaxID=1796055 RepID=A0AAV9UNB3_9PEZI